MDPETGRYVRGLGARRIPIWNARVVHRQRRRIGPARQALRARAGTISCAAAEARFVGRQSRRSRDLGELDVLGPLYRAHCGGLGIAWRLSAQAALWLRKHGLLDRGRPYSSVGRQRVTGSFSLPAYWARKGA